MIATQKLVAIGDFCIFCLHSTIHRKVLKRLCGLLQLCSKWVKLKLVPLSLQRSNNMDCITAFPWFHPFKGRGQRFPGWWVANHQFENPLIHADGTGFSRISDGASHNHLEILGIEPLAACIQSMCSTAQLWCLHIPFPPEVRLKFQKRVVCLAKNVALRCRSGRHRLQS